MDPFSSGTLIGRDGKAIHLALSDFNMTPTGKTWTSQATGATYPLAWTVTIPKLQIQLQIATPLEDQEFVSHFGPSYWEGAIDITGHAGASLLDGTGYLEMTGYAGRQKPLVSR